MGYEGGQPGCVYGYDLTRIIAAGGFLLSNADITAYLYSIHGATSYLCILLLYAVLSVVQV